MQTFRWIAWITGIVLAIALALQNNNGTDVKLLWVTKTLPLSVMLIVTLGIGFLFGALMTAMTLRRKKRREKEVSVAETKKPVVLPPPGTE